MWLSSHVAISIENIVACEGAGDMHMICQVYVCAV